MRAQRSGPSDTIGQGLGKSKAHRSRSRPFRTHGRRSRHCKIRRRHRSCKASVCADRIVSANGAASRGAAGLALVSAQASRSAARHPDRYRQDTRYIRFFRHIPRTILCELRRASHEARTRKRDGVSSAWSSHCPACHLPLLTTPALDSAGAFAKQFGGGSAERLAKRVGAAADETF